MLHLATLTWTLPSSTCTFRSDTYRSSSSIIVTFGVVEQLPGKRLGQFTPVWLLIIIVSSWLTVAVAQKAFLLKARAADTLG
jgi:hypothetical protein